MASEFFTGIDAALLHMDRLTNLAQVVGVLVFDTPLDRARLIEVIHQRLLIYDRFRQRVREPLLGLGLPRWKIAVDQPRSAHRHVWQVRDRKTRGVVGGYSPE